MNRIPLALTIAGSDSGGGAGIQADLKTFAALGVHGMSAITAITAQNTVDVTAIQDIDTKIIEAQIRAVADDIGVDAAKTGMLHTPEIIHVVADLIREYGFTVVVDPVMIAKSGATLLKPESKDTLIKELLPLAKVVTPNAMEAEVLSGINVETLDDAKRAAQVIAERGVEAVIVKGGHLFSEDKAIDLLYYQGKFHEFKAERHETKDTHGTGCSFASAIAAELAKGNGVIEAVDVAKKFVNTAILYGLRIGKGHGPLNPMAFLINKTEKFAVLDNVRKAVEILEATPEIVKLFPEVQINIGMGLPYATGSADFVAVPGRIVKIGNKAKASSCPRYGASAHVARTVLAVKQYDHTIRAGMNLLYSEEAIKACEEMGLSVSFYDRREEPDEIKDIEGMTTKWGAEQAVKRIGKAPDAIYHFGDWGKEPMIVLLGKDAVQIAKTAAQIAQKIK